MVVELNVAFFSHFEAVYFLMSYLVVWLKPLVFCVLSLTLAHTRLNHEYIELLLGLVYSEDVVSILSMEDVDIRNLALNF